MSTRFRLCKQLDASDKEKHLKCCHQLVELLIGNTNLLLLMADEAHICLNGTVNKQNFRYWSGQIPHKLHEHPLHDPKVTVCCGVSAVGITGPYFFENDYGQALTVTAECYKDMLETFLTPCLQMLQGHECMCFQQSGATAHTVRISMAVLHRLFLQ
jgi:hypothetical protein